MFQRIIHYSIYHKGVVGMLTLALLVWGVWSLSNLPFDATPDITNNQVQIIAQAPSLGAAEVEQFVTTPIEMSLANIPRVEERRSISRSGLAVITLVFDDDVDIYWARAQVNEQLKVAEEQIPEGAADVELGPVATALGEIYHYTIRNAEGSKGRKYTLTELRTMQDWIVRKQLQGTPGIAEVSGWGGYVKQYEVAVDADRLNSVGISIPELFEALKSNNENSGGSYIERKSQQYFIRTEGLVENIHDIESIPVKTVAGHPVLVRDVAKVQLCHAQRYGAVTRNGEGEVVASIAIMLKDENFQQVIGRVKKKIGEIQKTLPEGVVIEPFIDRTQLVDRVTDTIARNLIEGGLIVILILILFLGNYRAGLVVASVIPLSMLFAFGMMQLTGVSGNLMSLGAIDFGIIVDGAVIIVEAVCLRLATAGTANRERCDIDSLVFESSSKIRNSAAFGEIIIMVVYLPLLTLTGIEGKMFRPMALTIFFAILGAFLLSLTYVPMMSALVLRNKASFSSEGSRISRRINTTLQNLYRPLLRRCLQYSRTIVATMAVLLVVSVGMFTQMGGEFIPSLEEGDFAAEASMAQGTSLSQMVETCTKAEKILKREFPEVRQVVSRIGSAEIPTDPMPIERADIMISLKPKSEWTSAETTEELQEKMEETLSAIPGFEVEMSQPIQMRNNELISGIKQDVAIKVYGPDMDVLQASAARIARLIRGVKGVGEPQVEKVSGLPQIKVRYRRHSLAQYGISVSEANQVLNTAFAGQVAGSVYEQDRRFDMVLRLDDELRNDLDVLSNLYIPVKSSGDGNVGQTVPLSQVADITYDNAPAQFSHENGERRIYVGFNVHGRDVQSTVGEIQEILDRELKLPVGYHLAYGGEFENFQRATSRLMIAVPAALLLILLLLFGTLHNVREVLMVFTAVPLSMIGGVWALWLRDIPFSISAGVGFVALFGVAVLNGIVLIGQFKSSPLEEACMLRLRPVIMTALVASLGFLPMAVSTGDGAEVQRPLATVVIGGLVTASLLTLIVLPSIYKLFAKTDDTDVNVKP